MGGRMYVRIHKACNRRNRFNPANQETYPLHYYIRTRQPEFVLDMIKNGADINQQDENGCTPLIFAVCCGSFETVSMLLYYGADATIPCENNISPFMYSILRMNADMQEQLIEYETDFNRTIFIEDVNMLQLAIFKRSPHVIEIAKRGSGDFYSGDFSYDNIFILCMEVGNDEAFKYLWDCIDIKKTGFDISFMHCLRIPSMQCKCNILEYIIESGKLEDILDAQDANTISYLLQNFKSDTRERDLYEKAVYVLLTFGFSLQFMDLENTYLVLGDCPLFRNLLYMEISDINHDTNYDYMRGINCYYQYKVAVLVISVICCIQPGVTVKDLIRRQLKISRDSVPQKTWFLTDPLNSQFDIKNIKLFLDYFVDYDMFQVFMWLAQDKGSDCDSDNELWLKLERTVPSLLELSRNAFRYAACTKFNMTSSCKFYTYVNSLHVPGTIKKIISFEKTIY